MNKLLLTTAVASILAGSVTSAMATDVSQAISAAQSALNSLTIVQNDDPSNSQDAVNAANLVNLNNELNTVTQNAYGAQSASNGVSSVWGQFQNITQSATNVANSLSLTDANGDTHWWDDVSGVSQSASGTGQSASNAATFGQGYGLLNGTGAITAPNKQDAVNAFNLVNVDDIKGLVTQSSSAPQTATNQLVGGPGSYVDGADQTATNVANSISADWVKQISQSTSGNQSASNSITFGNGVAYYYIDPTVENPVKASGLLNATEEATNVVNVADITTLAKMSSQTSSETQQATNTITYVGPGSSANSGNVSQTATNAANILSATNLPSINGITEVVQSEAGTQIAQNAITAPGTLSGVVQSATNVANSLSNPAAQ